MLPFLFEYGALEDNLVYFRQWFRALYRLLDLPQNTVLRYVLELGHDRAVIRERVHVVRAFLNDRIHW